jgi:hypothetical protein
MKASVISWPSISGSKPGLLIALLLMASPLVRTLGQVVDKRGDEEVLNRKVEKQIKDVTATGPFPFYVAAHPFTLYSIRNEDIKRAFQFANQFKDTSLDTPIRAWGYAINGGVRILRTAFVEAGYTQLSRRQTDGPLDVRITERVGSVRLGASMGIYYPLSVQFYAGYVTSTTDFLILESLGGNTTRQRISISEDIWKGRKGFELGGRLVFMDPVGAGGGLGGYIEFRQVIFRDSHDYAPYLRALDDSATGVFRSDSNYRVFTVGFIAPLALRGVIGK